MPGRCSAFNCRNTFKNVKHKTNKVTFHSFPKRDPKRIKEWVGQMKWKDWQPTPHSLLCSEHFEERCMDRTGQTVRLRDDAIPTIFAFPSHLQKKVLSKLRQVCCFHKSPPTYINHSIWHPSRFHDDYCVPQVQSTYHSYLDFLKIFYKYLISAYLFCIYLFCRIKEKWQWLTMDVKGPFPETKSRHKFVLTVMDYYSKWMEAYPMKTNNSKEIAKIISDLISRFGFPVGILSCLTRAHILEVRDACIDRVRALHRHLVKSHPDRWDVYLAASVFSFCCKEHPTTRQIPLSLLRCGGTQSVSTSPRKLPCSQWSTVSQDSELKRYEEMKLGDEDYTHTCVSCRVAMSCRVALEVMRG
uniref:THAP-type domain-containing protein n=1 Tax=Hucho hucho TaxID=62062 RepID=A0A4W5PPH4_9TELE